MELIHHVIGGAEVPSSDGATFQTVDPWTRQPWARVARGTREDVERAVVAAREAFDDGPWPRMGYEQRGRLLHRLAGLLLEDREELARADTADMGKPITMMRTADVPRAAANFCFFADHARLRPSESFPMDSGHHAYTRYEPAGVVAAIAPWNFPLMLETWKIAPALAWGNTVVLKPAEDSPASATVMARLAARAGFQRACSTWCTASARTPSGSGSPSHPRSTASCSPGSRPQGGRSRAPPRPTSPR
jgi:aminomuconate-semialdehyde/2-hydroxymuconate-6-semialdehyde dehydrogenase